MPLTPLFAVVLGSLNTDPLVIDVEEREGVALLEANTSSLHVRYVTVTWQ